MIEAQLDKGKGPVATILVQKGTLHVGDYIAAGASSGKVRAMMDDKGRRVKEAGPSTPVEILGLSDVPNAGEVLVATESDKEAKNFAATFVSEGKNRLLEDTKAKHCSRQVHPYQSRNRQCHHQWASADKLPTSLPQQEG